jgi:predicted double-glycine peptidase
VLANISRARDNVGMLAFIVPPSPVPQIVAVHYQAQATKAVPLPAKTTPVPHVPFFSQFTDIQSPEWQQVGCGITSLAMIIDFYKPNAVSVDALLQQGIAAGAYDQDKGWSFGGLIELSKQYGLTGNFYDLSKLSSKNALSRFKSYLKNGPLILSIHNKFNPKSTLPHLIVIDAIKSNVVYYNDPAMKSGKKKISITKFLNGWEKKGIVVRPGGGNAGALSMADPNQG